MAWVCLVGLLLCGCGGHQNGVGPSRAMLEVDMVVVTDPGNAPDQAYGGFGPYGAMEVVFSIGRHEITNAQYAAFLNAMASSDPFELYTPATKFPLTQGILRQGNPGAYRYTLAEHMASKPVNFVTWHSAARFANWMANGQPLGSAGPHSTENGAYDMSLPSFSIQRQTINPNTGQPPRYFLPSEDEWYKAAYFDPSLNDGAGGYWLYATRSLQTPVVAFADGCGRIANPGANVANYNRNCLWGGSIEELPQGNLTTVGSAGCPSFYGTYDQAGNVWEWNEGIVRQGTARGLRQGSVNDPILGTYPDQPDYIAASWADNGRPPETCYWNAGFRLGARP